MSMNTAKRKRQKQQFAQLKLLAELLCESNTAGKRQELLGQILTVVLQNLNENTVNSHRRKELVRVFEKAGYFDDALAVLEGKHIYLRGSFDVDDLSKQMVWSEGGHTL